MKIIEQFTQGKEGGTDINDDCISVSDNFIAVIDGSTSRVGHQLKGKPIGQFASNILSREVANLQADIDARGAVDKLTEILKNEAEAAAKEEGLNFGGPEFFPSAALLVYSAARREIWRVADSTFVMDGRANCRVFPQERTWMELRRAYICAEIARGEKEEDLIAVDPTQDMLTSIIRNFKVFANYDGPYGYGVINGSRVPDAHIEVVSAAAANEITFASDGYPEVEPTLEETEKYLLHVVKQDPLMYKLHPQVKGVKPGNVSFDDRSYIRFKPG